MGKLKKLKSTVEHSPKIIEQSCCNHACCAQQNPSKIECFVQGTAQEMQQIILHRLECTLAREPSSATPHDWWLATCYAVRDKILQRYIKTQRSQHKPNVRRLYYLSLEYLPGSLLKNNLYNANLFEETQAALHALGQNLDKLFTEGHDLSLGNGGLGRLASCFLDSLATLNYPAIGYGIHYEFGLFRQELSNGKQMECPDKWMILGRNPWQISRPENAQRIKLYGTVSNHYDEHGDWVPVWENTRDIVGVPWDIPIVGYGAETVNFLRLWEARSTEEFGLEEFNRGDYIQAVYDKVNTETISKILYPNDSTEQGKELRLVQQYFFVACSIRDIIRRHKNLHADWTHFTQTTAIQLNDTHPTIAIVELMRIFVDEERMAWEVAWEMCREIFAYTNHTLLPEALETWTVALFQRVLPRHYQIICEINRRFLADEVGDKWPQDNEKKRQLSIISDGENPVIRMAHLAVVGSHSVNGVAHMHSELLKSQLFPDFHALYPTRFNNKTNGITPRRWLKLCNPKLSALIDSKIGTGWVTDLSQLNQLIKFADNRDFQEQFMAIKRDNKVHLAEFIGDNLGLEIDPDALFDVQIKRLHEYKRQHLNLLHILSLFRRISKNPDNPAIHPRTFIFGAKAAPGYQMAKKIIHAINLAAHFINNSQEIRGKLKVAFIPNYCVSIAEKIIPAADLSEQISTAGKEASGTGNMKLALNGACTIGTLDGANVEILEEVGEDNIFIFGNTEQEITALKNTGYNPHDYYASDEELKAVLDWMRSDFFATQNGENPMREIAENLIHHDPFFVLADYNAYSQAHERANDAYRNRPLWAKMAILNTALMGKFSSDRTINEYARDIWRLQNVSVGK
ncbi:MAG: glycogen/starch/alpha-glucan phosphorylase [Puniceicoccales bacterium]|jgi:starch phosphorylase|nr:glycogen/starch/alpha-glucan phosphorylase [Puniceicoccales bacterium]